MKDYKQLYREWLESPYADEETRAELKAIEGNDAEIYDRFYQTMEFGTAGMRGVLGAGTNRINRYAVRKATLGYARYLKKTAGEGAMRGVVIAHDNRRMSREFCMETAGVLAAEGIPSYIFDDLRPTPELSFAVRYLGAAGGAMITASHNPPEDNGYKLYDEQGCQLVPRYTDELIAIVREIEDPLAIRSLSMEEAGDLIRVLGKEVDEAYYKAVMAIRLRPDVKKDDFTVVYSPSTVREMCPYARCWHAVATTSFPFSSNVRPIRISRPPRARIPKTRRPMSWRWNMSAAPMPILPSPPTPTVTVWA